MTLLMAPAAARETDVDGVSVRRVESSSSSHSPTNVDNKVSCKQDGKCLDNDDVDVCRICHNPGDSDNPLRYPCACRGTIKFVHQDCLLQWLNHSNAWRCEVCKHPFLLSPVYAENFPRRLPAHELLIGMALKVLHVFQFFLTLVFRLFTVVRLLLVPYATFWMWRLAFVRSFGEVQRLFPSHVSAKGILADCLCGLLVSSTIGFILHVVACLRIFFSYLWQLRRQGVEREDGVINGSPDARRPLDALGGGGEVDVLEAIRRFNIQFRGNAFKVLTSNMIFLLVMIFLPFSLGRIVSLHLSTLLSSVTNLALSAVMPLAESVVAFANITLKNALTTAKIFLSEGRKDGMLGYVFKVAAETLKAETAGLHEVSANISTPLSAILLKGKTVGMPHLSDVTTLLIGYIYVISFCLGTVSLIGYARGKPLPIWTLFGIDSELEAISFLMRNFFAVLWHLTTLGKAVFLLVIRHGLFPFICGWWLDVCTLRMLGKTIAQRVEFFSNAPFASSLVHWSVGFIYILQIRLFVKLVQLVLRKGVLYFLQDPADPNYNQSHHLIKDSLHKHVYHVLLSISLNVGLIVVLVFLPVKLAMLVTPSVFPLDISLSKSFTGIPVDLLLFFVCIPFAIRHFKPHATIKAFICQWFNVVGGALGLTDFLLPRPENSSGQENENIFPARQHGQSDVQQGGVRLQNQAVLAPATSEDSTAGIYVSSNFNVAQGKDGEKVHTKCNLVLRIVLLLVLAWLTTLFFNSALMVVPVSVGRALFNIISLLPVTHGIKLNDIYAFVVGSYAIWAVVAGAWYVIGRIQRKTRVPVNQIWKWCPIVLKSFALLYIWIFVIPVLIGLLFELLVIVPIRVPLDESAVFVLYYDWALGLVLLKVWTRLVMVENMELFVDGSWRVKFQRVCDHGFSQLQGIWVLREIMIPILMKLLTTLCVPYVFAKGLFPLFGYSIIVNSLSTGLLGWATSPSASYASAQRNFMSG